MRQRRILRTLSLILAAAAGGLAPAPARAGDAAAGPMVFRTPEGDRALCGQGVAARCFDVAMAEKARGDAGASAAMRGFDRACRLGWSPACREYALLKLAADVRPADEVLLEYSKECKNGAMASCHYQALIYLYQNGKLKRFAKAPAALGTRAGELLVHACRGDWAVSCSEMGMVLFNVGKADGAEGYLRKGCLGGDGSACSFNGARPALLRDAAGMRAIFGRGCTLGDVTSCYYLGGALELSPRRADQAEAQQYYLLSCGLGVLKACVRVSGMRIKASDLEGAKAVLDGACAHGDAESCQLLGRVARLTYGDGQPHFLRAAELYRAACARGDGLACGQSKQAGRLAELGRMSGFFASLRYTLAVRMGRAFAF